MKFATLTILAALGAGAQAMPAPEANPHPLAAPQGEICHPTGAQVMSCSVCKYGFNPATCKPGATGTECSCNVCNNICTKDPKKREAEAEPEPKVQPVPESVSEPQVYDKICPIMGAQVRSCAECRYGFFKSSCGADSGSDSDQRLCKCNICGNFCFDDEDEEEHSKREAEPEPFPQGEGTCPPKDALIESCSECPYGFGDACTRSIPPICTCNGCGNKCVDDEEVSERSVAARIPPPEDICPAPGASCGMCMAGGPERCDAEVGADGKQKCYCRFCPDDVFCYA